VVGQITGQRVKPMWTTLGLSASRVASNRLPRLVDQLEMRLAWDGELLSLRRRSEPRLRARRDSQQQ
jgi:hypothetical protein